MPIPINNVDPNGLGTQVCISGDPRSADGVTCVWYSNTADFEKAVADSKGVSAQDGKIYATVDGKQVQVGTYITDKGIPDITTDHFSFKALGTAWRIGKILFGNGNKPERLPQDVHREEDYPKPPPANNGNSPIGTNQNQAAEVARDRAEMVRQGYTDIRQNQEQVDAQGVRVGRNRPDLQGTNPISGQREYIEYDQDPASGAAHKARILSNDPAGKVTTKNIK